MTEFAGRGDGLAVKAALADNPGQGREARGINRLPARLRLRVRLVRCRECGGGHIQPAMVTGQGRGIKVKSLEKMPLPPDAMRVLGRGVGRAAGRARLVSPPAESGQVLKRGVQATEFGLVVAVDPELAHRLERMLVKEQGRIVAIVQRASRRRRDPPEAELFGQRANAVGYRGQKLWIVFVHLEVKPSIELAHAKRLERSKIKKLFKTGEFGMVVVRWKRLRQRHPHYHAVVVPEWVSTVHKVVPFGETFIAGDEQIAFAFQPRHRAVGSSDSADSEMSLGDLDVSCALPHRAQKSSVSTW